MCGSLDHSPAYPRETEARVGADDVVVLSGVNVVSGFVVWEIEDCSTLAAVHDRGQRNTVWYLEYHLGGVTQACVRENNKIFFVLSRGRE